MDRAAPARAALRGGHGAARPPGPRRAAGARVLIRRLPGAGGLRFALAFAEQGFTALLSLGVTLWLIRRGTAEQLGGYVFWANLVLVAGTLIAAFTSVHLYRLPPGPGGRWRAERAILSANLLLVALSGLGTAALVAVLGPPFGIWTAALLVPGTVLGLHARSLAASRGALGLSAAVSAAAFLSVAALMAVELALGDPPSVPLLLAVNGAAQGLAGAAVILRLAGKGAADFGPGARRRWRAMARRSGWALLAGAANETFTRLYIFLVAAWFGPVALAGLAAAQAMLRPATLLAGAFGAAARAPLAVRRHEGDARGFWRLLVIGATGPALVTLALGAGMAALWPLVAHWVFGGRYEGLEGVVLLWAVVMAISCFWVAGLSALQVLGRLRALAAAESGGALTAAAAMPPLLHLFGPPGALAAIALGGVVQVSLMVRGVRRGLAAAGAR